MAEPTSRRDQVEEDLEEKLVDILKPEVEAAATTPPADEAEEPAKPAQTTDKDFFHALGGWGALLDIGLPWIAFLIVYAASDHDLRLALIVAVGGGAAVAGCGWSAGSRCATWPAASSASSSPPGWRTAPATPRTLPARILHQPRVLGSTASPC